LDFLGKLPEKYWNFSVPILAIFKRTGVPIPKMIKNLNILKENGEG
jgi:hypothetical protein